MCWLKSSRRRDAESPRSEPLDAAREVYGAQYPLINRYVDILTSTGVEWGLLGPREADRVWDRHILNCAALSGLIADRELGGGRRQRRGPARHSPGIAAAGPSGDTDRAAAATQHFSDRDSRKLGIADRVQVVRARAEDHHPTYGVVVARAVAPLDRLIGWCNPLRAKGGMILALKGGSAAEEVAAAEGQLEHARLNAEVLSVRAHRDAEPATVVRLADRSEDLG